MMAPRFDRQGAASGPVVQGFAGGGFSVDGGIYRGLFLTPKRADEWLPQATAAELAIAELEPILSLEPAPEFLLLGTGSSLTFPSRALIAAVEARGIGVETMDSRAAARTWGMLRSEDRWIVAAIMPL